MTNKLFLLAVIVCVLWCTAAQAITGNNTSWLITPDEAALAPTEEQEQDIRSRGLNDTGPDIEIVKPKEGESAPSPTEILIQFIPKRIGIDLATLKVTLLKFISIDLTERLRPFTSLKGITVSDAKVPGGTYRVRISLSDVSGNTTTKEMSFVIE